MTSVDVTDVLKRTQGTGDGSNVTFSFSFQVSNTNEVKVYEDATLKTEGTHYDIVDSSSASGLNANGTGVVKFKTSPTDYTPANGKKITILSVMSLARSSVYSSGGNITAASLESDFDRLHRIAGDFKEVKSRTLVAPEYDAIDINMTLPKEADRASSYLYFDSDGNPTTTSLLTTLSIGTGIIFEGSSADEFETTLTVADPSGSDKTITLPNATGTVSLLTATETLTNKTLTSPVLNSGVSGTAIKDEDNMSSNSATHLATQQSIKAYVDAQVTASDLDFQGDSGGALSIVLDSETLDIAGGTGIDTSGSSNTLTVAIDSTVVTLTGEQTLTSKTLTRPVMNTGTAGGAGNSVLIGYNAGSNAGSSHTYNVGIGYEAFSQMGTATNHYNVGIGYYALHDDGSSNNLSNVAIGNSALKFVDGASYNIGIGYQSLMAPNSSNHLTGDYNIAIGHEAGEGITSGSGNILLGYEANASSATATNELVIKTYDGSNAVTYLTGSASGTTGTITIPGNIVFNGTISGTGVDTDLTGVSGSDDTLASAKAIKTYVDDQKADMQFVLEDGDGTEVQITKDSEVKFVEGGGLDINWTDTSTGSDGDPYDLTFTINAAQTGITSLLATDIKIGEDDQTKIDFETADTINFYAGNEKQLVLTDGALTPGTNAIVDLGTDALEFKDAYFDGTVEADAITIGGTAIGSIYSAIAGSSSIVTTGALDSGSITSGFGTINTGSSAITTTGVITGGTLEATTDTAAGDNAAIGYTSAEGLILTGQGSTSDITVKNDADATVFTVPTGTDDILFPDDAQILVGSGSDLAIYHSSNNSIIADSSSGSLFLRGSEIRIDDPNSDDYIVCTQDGSVDIYHNGSKKFETVSGGVKVTGALETTGDIELGHASDTTIARSSAGVVTINTNTIATENNVGMDLLESEDASSGTPATVAFTSFNSSKYTSYMFVLSGIKSSSDNKQLQIRMGASSADSGENYRWSARGIRTVESGDSGGTASDQDWEDNVIQCSYGGLGTANAGEVYQAVIYLFNAHDTNHYTAISLTGVHENRQAKFGPIAVGGAWTATTDVGYLEFLLSGSDTFSDGIFKMYGLR